MLLDLDTELYPGMEADPFAPRSLEDFEDVIERGLKTFNEVGQALLSIREQKLYKPGYTTFEDYCLGRWAMKQSHAYRMMDAAQVMRNLEMSPIGDISPTEPTPVESSPIGELLPQPIVAPQLPVNEAQVRPLVSLEPEEQREAWRTVQQNADGKRITAAEVQAAVDQIARNKQRQETREAKVAAISAQNPAAIISGKFAVISADPPWRYDFATSDSRQIENQYPTMDLDEICALPVSDVAADDCVLFLWATSPKLPEAMQVMSAWGFRYRTCMVWVKHAIGMGYYARQRHEILLIGARGNLPVPEPSNRPDSVIEAPRTKHSAKPDESYTAIERMYPGLPKVELFSRQAREGWSVWGNQCTTSESA